jgi:hypothetical protein
MVFIHSPLCQERSAPLNRPTLSDRIPHSSSAQAPLKLIVCLLIATIETDPPLLLMSKPLRQGQAWDERLFAVGIKQASRQASSRSHHQPAGSNTHKLQHAGSNTPAGSNNTPAGSKHPQVEAQAGRVPADTVITWSSGRVRRSQC